MRSMNFRFTTVYFQMFKCKPYSIPVLFSMSTPPVLSANTNSTVPCYNTKPDFKIRIVLITYKDAFRNMNDVTTYTCV
jgi:hypothetical protein